MLDVIFMKVLDLSIAASVVILAVLAARLALARAPKAVSYMLWAVVLFRLLIPWNPETSFGMVPQVRTEQSYTLSEEDISPAGAGMAAYRAVGDALNGGLGIQYIRTVDRETVTSSWWEVWILCGQYVWLAGVLVMAVHSLRGWRRLRRKLVGALPLRDNIYLCDYIGTPFVLGLIRPRIYLPSDLSEGEQPYVILHEQHHIRRGDYLLRALAFLALCVHWFNPLVWAAFALSGRDMEMSCDEAVIRELGDSVRADYAASLLQFTVGRRAFAVGPIGFGETDVKKRIRRLADKRKPAIGIAAGALIVAAASLFLLITRSPYDAQIDDRAVAEAILAREKPANPDGLIRVESHRILDVRQKIRGRTVTVYALVLSEAYSPYLADGELQQESGSYIPTALTFSVDDAGSYELTEYWIPRDGSYYAGDIREKFPFLAEQKAFHDQDYIDDLKAACEAQARAQIEEQGSFDGEIAGLLDRICSEPSVSSNVSDYIGRHRDEYGRLAVYGEYTLSYCFGEFLRGGQTDLRGQVMAALCRDIISSMGEELTVGADGYATGQDWFDAFLENAEELARQYGEDEQYGDDNMEKYYPASRMLLEKGKR